jgi:hypothetical protein
MALRHRRFHSLAELNEAIADLLIRLNQRPSASAKARGLPYSPNSTARRFRRYRWSVIN